MSTTSKVDMSRFGDAEFMTADEKRRVLKAWVRFFCGGFQYRHFTRALYQHLIQHCSFIAHYDRRGFYLTYFAAPEATGRFLDQFDRSKDCVSIEYGMTYWIRGGNDVSAQYYDVNNAMVDAVEDMLPELRKRIASQTLKCALSRLDAAESEVAALMKEGDGR
ncbi:MAG TPA: hypothetical protein ENN09_05280 [Planctomycetes bacterium]|nr:hypothetical protein [Planctomycetota bacterium]